ncbi:phage tail sheath family protein [Azospirillum sp. sgz302134]
MAKSMYKSRSTPGVYITEFPAFPPSVVGVETAIPIFVGYTETARDPSSHNPLYMQPVRIDSLADYISYFGDGPHIRYQLKKIDPGTGDYDFQATDEENKTANYVIEPMTASHFNLFLAMRLFYANGGGTCFVVSVANYQGKKDVNPQGDAVAVSAEALVEGLKQAELAIGPTMIVVPDACSLAKVPDEKKVPNDNNSVESQKGNEKTEHGGNKTDTPADSIDTADYEKVVREMIDQAARLQNRVAILDLPAALDPKTWTKTGLVNAREAFYKAVEVSSGDLSYAVAYAPALNVSVLGPNDVTYKNLCNTVKHGDESPTAIAALLISHAKHEYSPDKIDKELEDKINTYFSETPKKDGESNNNNNHNNDDGKKKEDIKSQNNYLINALPLMRRILEILLAKLNVAPPSGVMAGLWTMNDTTRGVWNAPANMAPACVIGPKVVLNDSDQSDYNVPLNGKAICLLRSFPGRGTVVWGARTLDGNSNDYRYIQVRRTLIYVEQSIKAAIQPFVFAANEGRTWVTVTSLISNFLTDLWTRGGLMGDKPSDAFSVQCGLGSTMTAQDILNGYMIVSVKLQMIHPAEFIELTFTQMMQGA